jgi:hypothetical protein
MRLSALAVTGVLAVLAFTGTASAEPAEVTLHCTSFEYQLPPGPPPAVGEITVTLGNGTVVVDRFVPAPCSIPHR